MSEEPVAGTYGAGAYGAGPYGGAAALVMNALADGTAIKVAHQLVDVMSAGAERTTDLRQAVVAARDSAPEARPFLDLFLKLLADQKTNTVVGLIVAVVGVLQLGATLVSLGKSPDQITIEKQITEIHKTTINVFIAEDASPPDRQVPEPPAVTQPTGHPPPEHSPDSP